MSEQLELLTENLSQWTAVTYVTPEIQKKEIKPFVILALKELAGGEGTRTAQLAHAHKYAAVRAAVRHLARLRSAAAGPWRPDHLAPFLAALKFNPECVRELTSLLCAEEAYSRIPPHVRGRPPAAARARLDLSSGAPRVLLVLAGGGGARAYRLSVAKFQELRYTVASALKRVLVLERRRCMRD